jgi:chemotaxis protein histidine kinase CheA
MDRVRLIKELRNIAEVGIVNHKETGTIAAAADELEDLCERLAIMEADELPEKINEAIVEAVDTMYGLAALVEILKGHPAQMPAEEFMRLTDDVDAMAQNLFQIILPQSDATEVREARKSLVRSTLGLQ